MSTFLTLYNLSVRLETSDQRLINHIKSFLNSNYTLFQKAFGGSGDVNEVAYVSKIRNFNVWYLHLNQFKHLMSVLAESGYKIDLPKENIEDKRDYKVVKTNFKVRSQWTLREEQQPVTDFLLDSPSGAKLVPLATGSGKAQPLDSLVKIPGGWIRMGDIKVGTIVTAKDGTPTKVTGVYPQGKTPSYKLTFRDGRTTLASDEHLWKVFEANKKNKDKRWKVVNTLELKRLTEVKQPRAYVDLCDTEKNKDILLPLHPYLLGALLGDGCFRNGFILFSKGDKEIINKVEKLLPEELTLRNIDDCSHRVIRKKTYPPLPSPLRKTLTELQLMGKLSYEKFIPEEFLHGSHKQRIELINGLLDTDGTVDSVGGSVSFSSSSRKLAEQMQYLIRSVGGMARIHTKKPFYTYKGERLQGRDNYNVNIRYKVPSELFTLQRKKDLCKDNNQYADILKLRVESVEYIGEKETQCISIDHPDKLYVTDNFVVTHNTFIALNVIGTLKERMAIIIQPTFISKWISDIVEIHEAKQEDVMLVQGAKAVAGIIGLAQEGKLKHNYIIFSSRTLQDYIRMFEEEPEECVQMYGCAPADMFPLLGIGILLIDETHMSFHAIFKIVIHTNVKFHIGLSATLISEDPIVSRAHKVLYPTKSTYGDNMQKKYMDVYPIAYIIQPSAMKHVKTASYGSRFYSHTAFEQSIARKPFLLDSYIKLIRNTIEDYYTPDYMKDDKLIVFVATVNLATILVDRLQDEYPDKKILRYCEGDSYDEMLTADFIITTVISAGTGLDIPNLRVAIQTVSISSIVSNIQSAGRLRYLKDRDVKFCYIYAENIPKQKEYHLKRLEIFASRAANTSMRRSRVDLG